MRSWRVQSFRYVLVGTVSNLALYSVYLGLTALGVAPKLAMSFLFFVGVIQSFWLNRRWTFEHAGSAREALPRYATAYGGSYCLNMALLAIFVDSFGWPHQFVQGCAIAINALLLFCLQRHWVFKKAPLLPPQ